MVTSIVKRNRGFFIEIDFGEMRENDNPNDGLGQPRLGIVIESPVSWFSR